MLLVDLLLTKYVELQAYVHADDFDQKRFAGKAKTYADIYKQAEALDRIDESGRRIGELTVRIARYYTQNTDEVQKIINESGFFVGERASRVSDCGSFFLVIMQSDVIGFCRQVEVDRAALARMGE